MTTPNQPGPGGVYNLPGRFLYPLVPDGSYEFDGDNFAFGQDLLENGIKAIWEVPALTISGALSLLRTLLLRLPLEALNQFRELLPDVLEGAFDSVLGAVDFIMGALLDAPAFIKNGIEQLQELVQQILDLLSGGTVSEPLSDAVGAAGDFLSGIFGGFSGAGFDAADLTNISNIPEIPLNRVDGNGADATLAVTLADFEARISALE